MQDSQLLDLFWARSETVIEETKKQYGSLIHQIAANILLDERDVEECISDTLYAAWTTIPPQRPSCLRAYLCVLARNISTNRYHANTAVKRNITHEVALEELASCIPGGDDVSDIYVAQELAAYLNRFLAKLKEEDRNLFLRRYWFGDSVAALAEATGMNAHRISVRLFRLRGALKLFLIKEGMYE